MPAMLNYEFIWRQQPVENCVPFITKWNGIRAVKTVDKKPVNVKLPKFRYATADDFFLALDQSTTGLPSIMGERPNVWLYIHGPSHEEALTASRKGDILLPAAEKVASFNALANGSFRYYPESRLGQAWEAKIYPDHGWGGKNGDITDRIFLRKYEFALAEADAMLHEGVVALASQVQMKTSAGIPVVVFNTLSWKRDDPVTVPIRLEKGYATTISVKDAQENTIPCQLSNINLHEDGTIHTADLHFTVKNVPSLGYATFYIEKQTVSVSTTHVFSGNIFENSFYKIEFAEGGIKQIEDKELRVKLLDASKFLGGEVITMQSVGNGAGEFDKVQQPGMEHFDKVSNYAPRWTLKENGEVFTSFFLRSKIRNAVVEQTVTIYHKVKKIDFDVAILNWEGILYREYRMMLPVNIVNGEVSYEVPYGILRVGKDEMPGAAGERYNVENKDQRPRGIGNWIGVSGDGFGVVLSSSVAVADYLDPTDNPTANAILQPVLMASRKSCHGEGNEYLQHGDHYFHFSLTSHVPGWKNGYRFGQAANEKLVAVFAPKAYQDATLPQSLSFFDIRNENVVVSAIKKCEDDESIIIRLYNTGDQTEIINLSTGYKPKDIIRVNLLEEEMEKVNEMILGKYAIETFKFR
jgi:alpha-mannosidase